ncbi:hypothetical protein [Paraburkholderia sp. Ac-20340]|uniref:hypothetical protein n=1 Tax=Paraburkholderia sp. Ac-20340 TaxID=2703888 RepID=UPI00197F2513|nr:hypothetical protein [Paraburkholderia sp. Ac-20340]
MVEEIRRVVSASAGAKVIQFDRYLRAARVARAAGTAGAAATATDKLAAQPANVPRVTPALTPEQQRCSEAYREWERQQQYQLQSEKRYLFWPDAPGSTR